MRGTSRATTGASCLLEAEAFRGRGVGKCARGELLWRGCVSFVDTSGATIHALNLDDTSLPRGTLSTSPLRGTSSMPCTRRISSMPKPVQTHPRKSSTTFARTESGPNPQTQIAGGARSCATRPPLQQAKPRTYHPAHPSSKEIKFCKETSMHKRDQHAAPHPQKKPTSPKETYIPKRDLHPVAK